MKNNMPFVSTVKVRRDRIQAFLNGKLVAEAAPPAEARRPGGAWELPDRRALGIGAWFGAPAAFTRAELVEVGQAGQDLARGGARREP